MSGPRISSSGTTRPPLNPVHSAPPSLDRGLVNSASVSSNQLDQQPLIIEEEERSSNPFDLVSSSSSMGGLPAVRAFVRQHFGAWWSPSYLYDYAVIIVVFVVSGIIALFIDSPPPKHNPEPNPNFEYPYTPEDTVTNAELFMYIILIPCAFFFLFQLILYRFKTLLDLHNALMGLIWSLSLASMVTNVLKVIVGYQRPDYLGRVETGNAAIIKEGNRAFPSGHAALSWAAFLYLSLYMAGKLLVFSSKRTKMGMPSIAISVFIIAPLCLPVWIGATRITDYRHSPADVAFGAMMGIVATMYAYHVVYPPITSVHCDEPIPRKDGALEKSASAPAGLPNAIGGSTGPDTVSEHGYRVPSAHPVVVRGPQDV